MKFLRITGLTLIILLVFIATVIGCGGGGGGGGGDADTDDPTANHPPVISGIDEVYFVRALETLEIEASLSDSDNDAMTITWQQLEGAALWQTPPEGTQISLDMPVDSGVAQSFRIRATVSDGKDESVFDTIIHVPTSAIAAVSSLSESYGYETTADSDLVFTIESINSRGVFEDSSLGFEIAFSSASGATFSYDEIVDLTLFSGDNVTEIKEFFLYDETEEKLYIDPGRFEEFKALLGSDQIEIILSSYDSLGADISKVITFYYGFGTISGTFVDGNGQPYTGLEGETVELVGGFKSTTYETTVNADSTFSFIDLPADTYNLSLVTADLEVASSAVLINSATRSVTISPEVTDFKNLETTQQAAAAPSPVYVTDATPERLYYHNELLASSARDAVKLAADVGDELNNSSLTVTSAAAGIPSEDDKTVEIPLEVKEIKVVATVTSGEYPSYTSNPENPYNDAWSYTYTVGTQVEKDQGNVNTTHATQGTVTKTKVFKVNQTKGQPPEKVVLKAMATNIGDSAVATSVTLKVYKTVEELVIKKFLHKEGLGKGLSPFYYIGIASDSTREWNTTLRYSPDTSKLEKADCNFTIGTSKTPITNLKISVKTPGSANMSMGFSGATVPSVGSAQGKITCNFTAKNDKNKLISTSHTSNMEVSAGKDTLIPLTRYDTGPLRYGDQSETGGADWLRTRALNYMKSTTGLKLVYNDGSREHGGCVVKNSHYNLYNKANLVCIPGKTGVTPGANAEHYRHRDGTSVDTLYPTDTMNIPTVHIKPLHDTWDSNVTNAAQLIDWIRDARIKLNAIAASADVYQVYVGKERWFRKLLFAGQDTTLTQVSYSYPTPVPPGDSLEAWANPSPKIKKVKGHSGHLHIEFKK